MSSLDGAAVNAQAAREKAEYACLIIRAKGLLSPNRSSKITRKKKHKRNLEVLREVEGL
jgi:hypothetical protein